MSARGVSPWPWTKPQPVRLREAETIVWQGSPHWRVTAVRLFHVRLIAAYCGALMLADMVAARLQHLGAWGAVQAAEPGFLIGVGTLLFFAALAWGTARTTRYTVTNDRVVLQFGLALHGTLSIPLHRIAAVAVRVRGDATGDVVLQPHRGSQLGFVKLWPCVRPWHFAAPQPMLRDTPQAAQVATVLTRLIAASQRHTEPVATQKAA